MALGAQRLEVMRAVLFDGLHPTSIGLLLGLFASLATAELISSVLFGARPFEPIIFVGAGLLVLLISVCACTYPVWRAARIDPLLALRYELVRPSTPRGTARSLC
jgi:putative ABC transport system permease protein